jgi:2-polyprenyl-6-methoxyphenol hydroxylase-like FAD-dependent oxidoreductase
MPEIRKVLIIGGGVGGLTAAVALARRGIAAEVVEINPSWSVYGVGIIQPSNALRALAQIGLGQQCLSAGKGFPGWRIFDSQGTQLAEIPNENVAGPGYPPVNGITRPALHKILSEATLAQNTPVRVGVTVDRWSEGEDHVDVKFSDGSSGRYDLVIAADGAHSRTRETLFGSERNTRLTGEAVWRYNFPRPRDMDWGSMHFAAKSKAGLVPMSESLMYLFLVTMEPGNPRMPQERLHELLRERLQEYGGIVARLREQVTDPNGVVYRPMETLLLNPPWHRGRVVLIGDAVHAGTPHLAQGAAMAIEDSVLLAELLAQHGNLEQTLQAFAARRFPRCELAVKAGLKMGEWEMAEWQGRRDAATDHGGLMGQTLAALMQPI